MKRLLNHGGITFLIVDIRNEVYLLKGEDIINFIEENERKSIPYDYIKDKGYIIEYSYNPILDYLKVIDKIYY